MIQKADAKRSFLIGHSQEITHPHRAQMNSLADVDRGPEEPSKLQIGCYADERSVYSYLDSKDVKNNKKESVLLIIPASLP